MSSLDQGPVSTPIAGDDIDRLVSLNGYTDTASSSLLSRIIHTSNESFAPAASLLDPAPPARRTNTFTSIGAWYDGWESRRHNKLEYDWAILRIGSTNGSIINLVEVDTAWFNGNHAPEVEVWVANCDWMSSTDGYTYLDHGDVDMDTPPRSEPISGHTTPKLHTVAPTAHHLHSRLLPASDNTIATPPVLVGDHLAGRTVQSLPIGSDGTIISHPIPPYRYPTGPTIPSSLASLSWSRLLAKRSCGPSMRQAWKVSCTQPATHIMLRMYPDGGIARLRLYGQIIPPSVRPTIDSSSSVSSSGSTDGLTQNIDQNVASALHGSMVTKCSDSHFSSPNHILLPQAGTHIGHGWETKRSRAQGHIDWVIINLRRPVKTKDGQDVVIGGVRSISRVEVDTTCFIANHPQSVEVWVISADPVVDCDGSVMENDPRWTRIVSRSETGPNQNHVFPSNTFETTIPNHHIVRWAKLVIVPDGGVMRFRVYGQPV